MHPPSILPAGYSSRADTPLRQAVGVCRRYFIAVGLFSGVINLLQLTTSIYMMQVFDRVMSTRVLDTLAYLSLLAVFAILVLAVLEAVRGQILQRVGTWIEQRVAPDAFVRAIEGALAGGTFRMEALRDLGVCRGFLASPTMLSLYDVPWVPIYIGFIFLLHPLMGWMALGGALLLFALTVTTELTTSRLLKDVNTAATTSQRCAEAIARNAEVIDSMGMQAAVIDRWRESVAAMTQPQKRASDRAVMMVAATKFLRLAVQIAVLGIGAYLVLQQELTAGASIAGSIIMGRALGPVEQMIGGWKQLVQGRQSFRRLQAFLSLPRLRPTGLPLPAPTGHLRVDHVSYAFPGQGAALIKGVNFTLQPGETLAIIGPSAAGKTTLIRMLVGTLKPSAGTVRLDGADVFSWLREDFGRHVGYLPQDVALFDGSIFRNIARMGDAEPDAVYDAAKRAGCHEMILGLPLGYDTEITDGGRALSGGQRQLIGLARAMFGRPRFLVLDEPNSNMDGDGEAGLARALKELTSEGSTVVLVSHRPSLMQVVDRIMVLRHGAMDLFGPRAEVLKRLMTARPVEVPAHSSSRLEGTAA